MKKGMGNEPSFNLHTDTVMRAAGLLTPIMLFIYGGLVHSGIVAATHTLVVPALYAICTAWLLLAMYQYFFPVSSKTTAVVRLVLYHIFAMLYTWFVSGLDTPFISCWILLFFASYVYLGKSGLNLSVLVFFATAVGDALLTMNDPAYLLRSILYIVGTILVGYVGSTLITDQDVDRKELSRTKAEEILQRDRILTIVNNLADAVLSTDSDGVIQVYNAACLGLLDTNSELKGKNIDTIISLIDEENKKFRFSNNFLLARGVESREDLRAVISGETIRLSVIYSPIRGANSDNQLESDGYIVILRDITKQKSLEEERDEFISVISHELRTPLTIAEGSLSNAQIMMSRPDIPQTTLAESVKSSYDQVLYLAKLVNDLSTLSRAERGVADATEAIDVTALIHDLYNEYLPQAEAKGLQFNIDMPPGLGNITTSRLYLKELLQNFVTNAIKYTKEGDILVSVHRSGKALHFAVKDAGIGISKSDQVHIFEKFWRSEDYRTRETGGTGLGLYVSMKLAKKLGTTIELSSRLNHGSTFSFTLDDRTK